MRTRRYRSFPSVAALVGSKCRGVSKPSLLEGLRTCQHRLVAADDVGRLSVLDKLPMVNLEQTTAKTAHDIHIVRNHKNRLARISKLPDAIKTLFSKSPVSDTQYFVDNQNVRINLGGNRESRRMYMP